MMDEALDPQTPREAPRPAQKDLEAWRGDIRRRPPVWRKRPRSRAVLDFWNATRPLLARIGEGQSWD